MSPFEVIMDRLDAVGVTWKNRPVRLHHQRHGQLHDTFFVWHNDRARTPLDTHVDWTVPAKDWRSTGAEAVISRYTSKPLISFARGPLHLLRDDGMMCVTDWLSPDWPPYEVLMTLGAYSA